MVVKINEAKNWKTKNWKFLAVFAVLGVALVLGQPFFAYALEADYPQVTIPGYGPANVTPQTGLTDYIRYGFIILVAAAGVIGVFIIVLNGARILLAAGNPSAIAAARENIFGSLLGLVLLMFSVVILRTINPELVQVEQPQETAKPSVYIIGRKVEWFEDGVSGNIPWVDPDTGEQWSYTIGDYDYTKPWIISEDVPDVESAITSYIGWEDPLIFYKCQPPKKDVFVWFYDEKDFAFNLTENGTDWAITFQLKCIGDNPSPANGTNPTSIAILISNTVKINNNVKSFKFDYAHPGVYYAIDNTCRGVLTSVQRESGLIPKFNVYGLSDEPTALWIKNGNASNERYGVVLSKKNDLLPNEYGECSRPIFFSKFVEGCYKFGQSDFNFSEPSLSATKDVPINAYVLRVFPWERKDELRNQSGIVLRSFSFEAAWTDLSDLVKRYPNKGFTWQDLTGSFGLWLAPESNNYFSNLSDTIWWGRKFDEEADPDECSRGTITCLRDVLFLPKKYYVILYAKDKSSNHNATCEVLSSPVVNFPLKSNLITKESGRDIYKMYIVASGENLY